MPYPYDDTQQLTPLEDILNDVYESLAAAQAARIQAGQTTIVPAGADVITSKAIEFPLPFAAPPIVTVSPLTAFPGFRVNGVSVQNITTTGCLLYLRRSDTQSTILMWQAILP